MQTTRSSLRSFQASCPWPTSTEYTFTAPFCSIQSVKPPVEAPTSMQIFPSRRTPKRSMAFSSFSPPRLTYFKVLPLTSMGAVSSKVVPALSSFCPFTYTIPDMIKAFAFSRDSARLRFTSSTSNRSFICISPVFHSDGLCRSSPFSSLWIPESQPSSFSLRIMESLSIPSPFRRSDTFPCSTYASGRAIFTTLTSG